MYLLGGGVPHNTAKDADGLGKAQSKGARKVGTAWGGGGGGVVIVQKGGNGPLAQRSPSVGGSRRM